jgi:hypothetical protein
MVSAAHLQASQRTLSAGASLLTRGLPVSLLSLTHREHGQCSAALRRPLRTAVPAVKLNSASEAQPRVAPVCACVCCSVIFLALEELFKRKMARSAAAASHTDKTVKTPETVEIGSKVLASSSASILSRHVDPAQEQQVLTVKGYHSLPSTSPLLNADGVVESVYLLGLPLEIDMVRWMRARAMVSGRLVNGYCADDWLLRYFFAAANVTNSIAGLRPVTLQVEQSTKQQQRDVERLQQQQSQSEQRQQQRSQQKQEEQQPQQQETPAPPSAVAHSEAEAQHQDAEDAAEAEEAGQEGVGDLSAVLQRNGDVDQLGIENYNLTGVVDGHSDYPNKLDQCLQLMKFKP